MEIDNLRGQIKPTGEALADLDASKSESEEVQGGGDSQGRLLIGTEGGIWREESAVPSSIK